MLFSRWADSPQQFYHPLSGHDLPCRCHQDHFDQQVHHQCSDQRCETVSRTCNRRTGLGFGLNRAMRTVTAVVAVLLLVLSSRLHQGHGVMAWSCAPCDPDLCPETRDCRGGVVIDICNCCQVCAKMENESCGGSFGFLGKCDRNLQCFIQPMVGQPITGWEAGICKVIPEFHCNDTNCPTAYQYRLCPPDSFLQTFRNTNDTLSTSPPTTTTTATTNSSTDVNDVHKTDLSEDHNEVHKTDHVEVHKSEDEQPVKTSFCVCNVTSCHVPTCAFGFVLHLRHNASKVPGDCCDEFFCKTAQECDTSICPPLDETPCPQDSIRLPNVWTPDRCCEIQQGCTCPAVDLCPPVGCPTGFQLQITARAKGKPGACCDDFRCVNESALTCTYQGQKRTNGERWKIDKCRTCVCQDGINRCKDRICPEMVTNCMWAAYPEGQCCPVCQGCISESGALYNNSAVWKESECTTCTCVNGHAQCQAEMCATSCRNPKRVPGQCCPVCPDQDEKVATHVCPSIELCPLSCSQGLEKADDGCPRCQCRKEKCTLKCPYGHQSDVEGNPRCECQSKRDSCPTLAEQACDKKCEYGYKVSSEGCVKCKCKKCPPFKCTKRCLFGLKLNDEGCPICKCKDKSVPDEPVVRKELQEEDGRSCMSQSGVRHDNGESWDDRCRVCYCHNGKEMCSIIACPAPQCPNPVYRLGDCCPSCPGIMLPSTNGEKQLCQANDGGLYVEGETWNMDSCNLCVCHGGSILCETPSCPPLLCHHPVRKENQCCATCKGNDLGLSMRTSLRRRCKLSTGMIYRHRDIWRSTPCQTCVCQDGQFHCFNQLCPVLTCTKTVSKKNQCCPTCVETVKSEVCTSEGDSYNSGESWHAGDNCTECQCSSGKTICHPPTCPHLNCSVMIRREGQCCPKCYNYSDFQPTTNGFRSSVDAESQTEKPESSGSDMSFVIPFVISLVFVVVLMIVIVLLLCLRRKRQQFPFHKKGQSASNENPVSTPFLPSHTKTEKLYLELAPDRMKGDRVTNNYTEIVFRDSTKEPVANGLIVN